MTAILIVKQVVYHTTTTFQIQFDIQNPTQPSATPSLEYTAGYCHSKENTTEW